MCIFVKMCKGAMITMKVRGQLLGLCSLLPPRTWDQTQDVRLMQQAPLPAEPRLLIMHTLHLLLVFECFLIA